MDNEHWFDRLNLALIAGTSRRHALRGAATLAAGFLIGGPSAAEAKKNKKRKRKHKKKRRRRQPNPKPPCSQDACAQHWPGQDVQIGHCEDICRTCGGTDPREFCIAQDDSTGLKIAACCLEGGVCCGGHGGICCGGDPAFPDRTCCAGECVSTNTNDQHCGRCGNVCPAHRPTCCQVDRGDGTQGGACVDTMSNHWHCNACGNACQPGEMCCNGQCKQCNGFFPCC